MKINELKKGMSDIEVNAKVISVSEPRAVQTKYGPNTVADIALEDDSGSIDLTLWGQKISLIKEGDQVEIQGGYVTEWNNTLKLNIPKSGKLNVLG